MTKLSKKIITFALLGAFATTTLSISPILPATTITAHAQTLPATPKSTAKYTWTRTKSVVTRYGKQYDVVTYKVVPKKDTAGESKLWTNKTNFTTRSAALKKVTLSILEMLDIEGAGKWAVDIAAIDLDPESLKEAISEYCVGGTKVNNNSTISHHVCIKQSGKFVYVKRASSSNSRYLLSYVGNRIDAENTMLIPVNKKQKDGSHSFKYVNKFKICSKHYGSPASYAIDFFEEKGDFANYTPATIPTAYLHSIYGFNVYNDYDVNKGTGCGSKVHVTIPNVITNMNIPE